MVLRVDKGEDYFYGFPTPEELSFIEKNFDFLFDLGFRLKKLTQEEYESEIEAYNNLEMDDLIRDALEAASFALCDEFSQAIQFDNI